MPNRIIKESICTSEKISSLTDFQFRLWIGLITQADDAGRFDARPAILKGHIFPLRERVTVKDIDASLRVLSDLRCVALYEIGGRPYGCLTNWTEHQRVRDVKPRYPAPTWEKVTENSNSVEKPVENSDFDNLRQSAAICGNPPQAAEKCRLNPNPNPNPNPNTNPNTNTNPTRRASAREGGLLDPSNPPSEREVEDFFREKGLYGSPAVFHIVFSAQGWNTKDGEPIKDWHAVAEAWSKTMSNGRKPDEYVPTTDPLKWAEKVMSDGRNKNV